MRKQSKLSKFITDYLIISTANLYYQFWKILQIILSLTSCFFYMYMAAFLVVMSEEERDWFVQFDQVVNVPFVISLLLNFFVEYHYVTSHVVEREFPKLAALYFKGRFLIDLITVLPLMRWASNFMPLEVSRVFLLVKQLRLQTGL